MSTKPKIAQNQKTLELENETGKQLFAQGKEPEVINVHEIEARQQAVDEGAEKLSAIRAKADNEAAEANFAQEELVAAKTQTAQAAITAKTEASEAMSAKAEAELAQKAANEAKGAADKLSNAPKDATTPQSTDTDNRLELNKTLDGTLNQLNAENAKYDTDVLQKKNLGQQGMDNIRQAVWGTKDDQVQNFADTREKVEGLQSRVLSKQISVDDAKKELSSITDQFNTKTDSVAEAQARLRGQRVAKV